MKTPARLALASLVLLAACPKRVMVNGQEMDAGQAQAIAARDLAQVRAESASLPPEEAAPRFEAVAERYAQLPAGADALYEAGVRWRAAGRPDRAQAALSQLLVRQPLSPRASEAKYQLALAEAELGRPREAAQSLGTLYDKLPPSQRAEAARDAARASEAGKLWADAARWWGEAARLASGAEREAALAKAVTLVDAQLSFLDVSTLEKSLPSDSPLLPAVTMKLARVQLHLHQEDAALESARRVAEKWPDSPFAADARALADRLSRRAQVSASTIGVAVPLTGKQKAWGEAILQGVQLALEGSALKLVVKDTRGEPEGAQAALEELATEGAVAALGGVVNQEAPRAAQAAQDLAVPFVSLSRADNVTGAGPYVFRNMLTAEAQAKALAEFAVTKRGLKRFAVLFPQVPYGQELAHAFWDEVEKRGGEMRGAESYEFDRTTFAPIVKGLVGKLWLEERTDYVSAAKEIAQTETDPFRRRKALEKLRDKLPPVTDFQAVFIPDFAKNVALVTPALAVEDVVTQTCDAREVDRIKRVTGREDLTAVQLLGANGWDDPALVERAGKYVECAVFVDGFFAASERPETKAFTTAFQARFAHPPSILEASAYDAARLLRKALEGGAATREAVREALAATRAFAGATGELSFDARREVQKPLFFLTVDKAVVRELTPQELAPAGSGGS